MNFFEFQERFPTEMAVIEHFIKIRYGGTVACHHCGSLAVYQKPSRPKIFHCVDCRNTFSVFKNTIFEHSHTDLRKWMYAIHLFLNAKKGVSGYQLHREIGVTYKTAWRMLKQIRVAMGNVQGQEFIETVIEIDETYIGGKPRPTKGLSQKHSKRGRGTKKIPVVGILDRENKKVYVQIAHPDSKGKQLTGKQLMGILSKVVKKKLTVVTDEFRGYNALKGTEHIHFKINHKETFVDLANGEIHTNNIEAFWAIVKRGMTGIYHFASPEHLQQYMNEFSFRYNNRNCADIFDLLLEQSIILEQEDKEAS